MIKALIVEDESKAQRILQMLIKEHFPVINIVAICDNVKDGIEAAEKFVPDLVFLDIEMPIQSGFKFIEHFNEIDFEIIFTTAYSNYAIKAFEFCAIGYILKPIQITLFKKTVENAIRLIGGKNKKERFSAAQQNIQNNRTDKIVLANINGYECVETKNIILLRADGPYAHIFFVDGTKKTISKTLKDFEEILDDNFFRPHRSFMINLQHVKKYIKSGKGLIEMENDLEAEIARDKKEIFDLLLQKK
jgi:two-component system LytT family response regulator